MFFDEVKTISVIYQKKLLQKATERQFQDTKDLSERFVHRSKILIRTLLILATVFVTATASYTQSEDRLKPSLIDAVYLAKSDKDGNVGDVAEEFITTDIPIYCIVELTTSESLLVRLNFVAVKVAGMRPGTVVVKTQYRTNNGETVVHFSGSPEKLWPVGVYRVDVFAGDDSKVSIEFNIKAPQK